MEDLEIYRLTFSHYIKSEQGRHMIEEPMVVEMVVDNRIPCPVYLNSMLDRMRHEILRMEGDGNE